MKTKIILILFLITTKLTFGQIKNGGFEMWDTLFYTSIYYTDITTTLGIPDAMWGVVNSWILELLMELRELRTVMPVITLCFYIIGIITLMNGLPITIL